MEGEVVRDSMLLYGRPCWILPGRSGDRRYQGSQNPAGGVYISARHRITRWCIFARKFDGLDAIECYERSDTVAPQQALALANSKMSFTVAGLMAGHLGGEAPPAATFVEKAFEAVLGRPPSPEELDLSQKFIEQEQERFRDPEKQAWQQGWARPALTLNRPSCARERIWFMRC